MIDCSKAKNYLSEKNRITKSYENGVCSIKCINCPLSRHNNGKNIPCTALELQQPETAITIVQEWSNEHSQKTYLSELLRNYPDAELDENGIPLEICPHALGLKEVKECGAKENCCAECWNQVID